MVVRVADIPDFELTGIPIRVRRLVSGDDSKHLSISSMTINGEHPRMRMAESDVVYYAISGEGWFELGDAPRASWSGGEFVLVPSDTEYAYGGDNLVYLNIQGPAFNMANVTRVDKA
jgi:hypothetical protein